MNIKVLGPGCARCVEAEQRVRKVVQALGSDARVDKVTDFREMMALGVLSTPAVVLDDKLMCTGRVPSEEEIRIWITSGGEVQTVLGNG